MSKSIKNNYTDCEILAPAGSYQCMVAAFNAGADAVYVGGSMFGARAYAGNFDNEELISAIDYAHIRGKRLYLTVNTLLKPAEIETSLTEYLIPLYEAGLDAVIVQDLGVLKKIRENFPDLAIHASTQMTVTGVNFAKELKNLGVTRIVTARELSYKEISEIYEETGLEIESFVHGALCYCYSGQCLMSSMIGGRSGNRGRCAQPCRLNYDLYDSNNKKINKNNDKYLLSPKDMCTINILPQILKAGVYSLKIEGRMKKPEYVAGVVSAYRKYIDMIKSGKAYKTDENDIEELREIYNRGGFTDGFYVRQNGREMMSLYKPNHYGVKAAEIINISGKCITVKAVKDIDCKDVLEINLDNNTDVPVRNGRSLKKGETAEIKNDIKELKSIQQLYERSVFRTRNNKLIEKIENDIINKEFKVSIAGNAIIKANEPMMLSARLTIKKEYGADETINVSVTGTKPETASSRPAAKEDIIKRLKKTGNTDFVFESIDIELDDNLFIPVSALNELRRNLLEELRIKVLGSFKRRYIPAEDELQSDVDIPAKNETQESIFECVVSTDSQLKTALAKEFVSVIGIEISRFSYDELSSCVFKIKAAGKKAYLALPYICRSMAVTDFEKHSEFFKTVPYDGIIVRNYEEYLYFSDLFKTLTESEALNINGCRKIIFDTGVYNYNKDTSQYIKELAGRNSTDDVICSVPYELNCSEIEELKPSDFRMEIYGYIPVMISAGCVKKTTGVCDGRTGADYYLKDRLNNRLNVISNCRYCYNIVLNSVPLYLGNDIETLKNMGMHYFSMRFTVEDGTQTEKILDNIEAAIEGSVSDNAKNDYTRGHFRRGVM